MKSIKKNSYYMLYILLSTFLFSFTTMSPSICRLLLMLNCSLNIVMYSFINSRIMENLEETWLIFLVSKSFYLMTKLVYMQYAYQNRQTAVTMLSFLSIWKISIYFIDTYFLNSLITMIKTTMWTKQLIQLILKNWIKN